jgi:nucleoid-associated protein YgaU
MTQEIKLGLLLGLGFVIMVGILLSEYFRSTLDTPSSMMVDAGASVRGGVTSPGTANPPIHVVPPQDAPPRQRVPTNDDVNPAPPVVVPSNPGHPGAQRNSNPPGTTGVPQVNPDLQRIAQKYGQAIVPLNGGNSAQTENQNQNQISNPPISPPPAAAAPKEYVAQPGDSLSRMAKTLLGSSNAANRQAIINANPSLKDDPDHVVAGQTYIIPVKAEATANSAQPPTPAPAPLPQQTNSEPAPSKEVIYTVKPNDSIWKIANNVVGDPSTVDAIKELNADVLNGNDVIKVGMKLRLPKNTTN